jgi:hypothetical protein
MPSKNRDYQQENLYKKRPEQIKKRVARNKARRMLMREGVVRKGDGKDVAHKNGNAHDNRRSNLEPMLAKKNRSYPRTKTAGKKNPTD